MMNIFGSSGIWSDEFYILPQIAQIFTDYFHYSRCSEANNQIYAITQIFCRLLRGSIPQIFLRHQHYFSICS